MAMTSANGSSRTWWQRNQQTLTPWVFLIPGMFMFAVYVVWPILSSFWISFYDWNGLRAPDGSSTAEWVGMGNYRELIGDDAFETSLKNNIIWLVLYMLAVPFGLFIAIFLNQTVWGIRMYKSLFFFPFVISQVVVGLIFSWFYAPNFGLLYLLSEWLRAGEYRSLIAAMLLFLVCAVTVFSLIALAWYLGNLSIQETTSRTKVITGALLGAVLLILYYFQTTNDFVFGGLASLWSAFTSVSIFAWPGHLWDMTLQFVRGNGQGVAILADPGLVTYGIIAAGLWPQTAYCMILYLTGLNNVSPDQVEAARLDGAKGFKMLWYVILPQLRPATFIAVVVTVIGALRSFDLVSIMTTGGPFGSSRVLSFYMYEQALSEYGFRMGYGAAIAVVLFLIMMVFISGFIWKMVRDEKEGY